MQEIKYETELIQFIERLKTSCGISIKEFYYYEDINGFIIIAPSNHQPFLKKENGHLSGTLINAIPLEYKNKELTIREII